MLEELLSTLPSLPVNSKTAVREGKFVCRYHDYQLMVNNPSIDIRI